MSRGWSVQKRSLIGPLPRLACLSLKLLSSSSLCQKVWLQHVQETQLRTPPGELCGWPFEGDDRNFAGRLLLILAIGGKYFYCPLKRLFSLIAGENAGGSSKFLTANLNRNFRVSQQVEIPIRMFRMPSFGRDRKKAITISHKHQGSYASLTCFSSCSSQQH